MQKHVNLVDLVKSFPTNIYLQNLASIQKRTSHVKFAHLAENSEKGSISNLSTKVAGPRRAALAQLADRAQLDVFEKIKKSIDEMIATLKEEQAHEVMEKDNCVKEIRENEKAIQIKQRAITELTAFMEEAEATLKTLSKEIVDHKAEVQSVISFTFQ